MAVSRRSITNTDGRGTASDGLELWPADRVQLAIQGIVLRENGYQCDEGVAYYAKTRQRVRVPFDDALIAETEAADRCGLGVGASAGPFLPPLVDSPKCPGCSLVGICLPDETTRFARCRDVGRPPCSLGSSLPTALWNRLANRPPVRCGSL